MVNKDFFTFCQSCMCRNSCAWKPITRHTLTIQWIRLTSLGIWASRVTRDRRYGIFSRNDYFHWMNNQIFFWMNIFFEWIFLPYYWMNCWMNQKSAKFIRKMNKKCILRKKRPILRKKWPNLHVFPCYLKLRLFFQFE